MPKLPKAIINPGIRRIREYIPFPVGPNPLEMMIKAIELKIKIKISFKKVIELFLEKLFTIKAL
jgi:hypothetical protein